jgi:hypothetical protein
LQKNFGKIEHTVPSILAIFYIFSHLFAKIMHSARLFSMKSGAAFPAAPLVSGIFQAHSTG